MEMDVQCANFEWTEEESIRSELIKFEDLNISWYVNSSTFISNSNN